MMSIIQSVDEAEISKTGNQIKSFPSKCTPRFEKCMDRAGPSPSSSNYNLGKGSKFSKVKAERSPSSEKVANTLTKVSERLGLACQGCRSTNGSQELNSCLRAPSRSLSLQCLVRSPPEARGSCSGTCISSSSGSLNSFLQLEQDMVSSTKDDSLGSFSLDDQTSTQEVMKKSTSFWDSPTRRKKKKKRIPFLPPLVSGGRSSSATLTRNLSCQSLIIESTNSNNFDRPCGESHTLPGSLSELTNSPTGSILPPITTREARSRSYLVGRVSSRGSLLGVEEMIRYFPDKKLKVFVGTWNMNGQSPPKSLNDFLLPESVKLVPDMYVIGTQEGPSDRRDWEIGIQSCLGPSHVLFHSASLGVLHLAVFLRRDLIWFCSVPEDDSLGTRPGTMVKTKGAVAISFVFFGVSFLFINSHLTAHEKKTKERVADYEKICNSIALPKNIPPKAQYINKDATARFDYVFWCGDLNFRLEQERSTVIRLVDSNRQTASCYQALLQYDQLRKAMNKGIAFRGFQEPQIRFEPSYKYDSGSSDFDTVKQRVPSYTDRVLYRCKTNNSVECCHYSIVPDLQSSDHRPVFAIFDVNLRPGRDDIPLSAGLFVREVYLEGNKRRAKEMATELKRQGSVICSIM